MSRPYDEHPLPSFSHEYRLKADYVGELDNLDDEELDDEDDEEDDEDADDEDDETAGDEGIDDGYSE